jgi:hypothetical protein
MKPIIIATASIVIITPHNWLRRITNSKMAQAEHAMLISQASPMMPIVVVIVISVALRKKNKAFQVVCQ